MKRLATLGLIFAAFTFSNAYASDVYTCSNGDNTRVISVFYEVVGQQVPCEVLYEKDTGRETLWNAQNQVGYCEDKAAEFAAQQEAWGWSCTKS